MNSKLQIISGRFHGRKLFLSKDARPTQNRSRAALFNMLASGILEADRKYIVWDAFAGSGALGLEFLSRYPHSEVLFTDVSDESMNTIRKNLSELKLGQEARIEKADALIKVKEISTDTDVVFVDAPYANAEMGGVLIDSLSKKLKDGALVIWEQEASNFALPVGNWVVLRDKTYGRARFLILQLKNK